MIKIAYVCVHNSCRSQIAEAITNKYCGKHVTVYSAGTMLKDRINQDAVRLMKDIYDIDMEETQRPKLLEDIPKVDYIITMGCNVTCPVLPYDYQLEDWGLDDPTGKNDDEFIKIINIIEDKVKTLLKKLEG